MQGRLSYRTMLGKLRIPDFCFWEGSRFTVCPFYMQYPGLLEVITTKFFSGYFILPLWICSILQVGGTVQVYGTK